jgi:hypothetical protein
MQQRMHQYKNNPGQSQQQLQAQRQQVWRSKLYLNINHIPLHLLSKYIPGSTRCTAAANK